MIAASYGSRPIDACEDGSGTLVSRVRVAGLEPPLHLQPEIADLAGIDWRVEDLADDGQEVTQGADGREGLASGITGGSPRSGEDEGPLDRVERDCLLVEADREIVISPAYSTAAK